MLTGALAVLGGNAAWVAWRDPLLFWAGRAGAEQPLFYAAPYGNFSRHVYAGLMRSVDYDEIWIGPSYAAPLTATGAHDSELMVTMGHMNGAEMAHVVGLEASLRKARVVNLVLSPMHFTAAHIPGKAAFPRGLYGTTGALRYVGDFSVTRLALVHGARDRPIDFKAPEYRRTLNTRYFWMHDDRARLREYWDNFQYVAGTRHELAALRENLPPALALGRGEKSELVTSVVAALFAAIDRLDPSVKVNLIFPPAHLTYWAAPPAVLAEALQARADLAQGAAARPAVRLYDFASDWDLATDRGLYYDGGHFTTRAVPAMREALARAAARYRALEPMLEGFLSTTAEFDEAQVRAIAP